MGYGKLDDQTFPVRINIPTKISSIISTKYFNFAEDINGNVFEGVT